MIGPCSTTFLMVNDGDFWWRRNRLPVQGSKLIIARMDVSLTISTPGYVYIYIQLCICILYALNIYILYNIHIIYIYIFDVMTIVYYNINVWYMYIYVCVCYVLCMCIICIFISTRELFLIWHPFFWSMLWMSSCRANRQTMGSPGQIYLYIQYIHFSEEMWYPAPLKYDRYVLYPLKEGHPKWSMIWVRSCWLGHIRAGAPGQGP